MLKISQIGFKIMLNFTHLKKFTVRLLPLENSTNMCFCKKGSVWFLYCRIIPFKGYFQHIFAILCFFLKSKRGYFSKLKNVFYFTSEALFILEMFRLQSFRILSFMTLSNVLRQNKNYILLNVFGSQHILVMKFVQFMWCYKGKIYLKII